MKKLKSMLPAGRKFSDDILLKEMKLRGMLSDSEMTLIKEAQRIHKKRGTNMDGVFNKVERVLVFTGSNYQKN